MADSWIIHKQETKGKIEAQKVEDTLAVLVNHSE